VLSINRKIEFIINRKIEILSIAHCDQDKEHERHDLEEEYAAEQNICFVRFVISQI